MIKNSMMNLTFRDFIKPFFRQKLVIVMSLIIISTGVYLALLFQTPKYEARVLIQIKGISHVAAPTYEGLGGWRIHMTQMAIATSNPVIKRTVQALGLDKRPLDYEKKFCHPLKVSLIDYYILKEKKRLNEISAQEKEQYMLWKAMTDLKNNITTRLEPNTDLIVITVSDFDAAKAIEIANVLSRAYTIYDLQQQLAELTLKYGDLHPTVQQLQDNITKMSNNLTGKEISDLDSLGSASVKIVEQATTDFQPVGRSKYKLMLIGLFAGGFFGLALALFFDLFNQTFKSPNDSVEHLDLPTLGSIPRQKIFKNTIIKDLTIASTFSEFYNDLSDQLFIFMKVQNLKSVLFVSVTPQKYNAVITTNLSSFFSRTLGLNTLLVDANITQPIIHKLLKHEEKPGLFNIFDDSTMNINEIIQSLENNFNLLQAGTTSQNGISLLKESKIKNIMKKLKSKYNAIFIDCTLINKLSDIAIISSNVDGVVVVVNEGKDHIQAAKNVVRMLKQNNANIIGCILNNRTLPIPNWLYKRI